MTTTTLVLARHGEAAYESDLWSDAGGSLTQLGRAQADDLADRLGTRPLDHVWTSTMARAVQTGEIVAARRGTAVTTRHDLRELEVGDHAGSPLEDDPFAPTYAAWLAGDLAARIPGAESGREVADRVARTLADIASRHPGGRALVVSHGGALRLTVPGLCRMDVEPTRLPHCGTIEVEVHTSDDHPPTWVCTAWG